jgi:hypothetical protein
MRSSSLRGAYVDNKGVRWDTNDADFEGWMSKQSKWISEWRKRYFVLKGSKLFFSKVNLMYKLDNFSFAI